MDRLERVLTVLLAAAVVAPVAGGRASPPPGTTAIALSKRVVVYGGSLTLTGTFSHSRAGETVAVYVREFRQNFRRAGSTTTRKDGVWRYSYRPRIESSFEALSVDEVTRSPLVRVRPRVTIAVRAGGIIARVDAGRRVAGKTVELQRRVRGRWLTIERARVARPAARFRVKLPAGGSKLRVFISQKQVGPGYLDGFSRTFVVRR